MIYVVLVLALALACVAGVQLFYVMFLQNVIHHDKRRMEQLEKRLVEMERELIMTSRQLELTEEHLASALEEKQDKWPEIIDG